MPRWANSSRGKRIERAMTWPGLCAAKMGPNPWARCSSASTLSAVYGATRFMPKPLLSRNRTSRVSRSQEFERLSNELLVVLEDAAVSGVRVDPQRRIWKATRQVVRIGRRHHAIVITVDHQDGMVDARQLGRLLKPPRVNRFEVRPEDPQCDGLIPIVGALF